MGLTVYVIYEGQRPLDPFQEASLFLLLVSLVVFFRGFRWPITVRGVIGHLLPIALSILAFGYIVLIHKELVMREGIVTIPDMVLGTIALIICLEATRRTLGWALTGVTLAFIAYIFLGQYIPRELGGHTGYSFHRFINAMYLSSNGIFGVTVYVVLKYVYLFVVFGKLLEYCGALDFIMNLAKSLLGRVAGGPAMVSVLSSGMAGSVTGSAVANVMITGSVTIPLMKRLGFEPHVAGAVEASASNGGQFMPPVMGAAAFLMMQFIRVNYIDIMKAALLPAVLYFWGIMVAVYIYSRRRGLRGLPANEIPPLRQSLRPFSHSLAFLGGFGVLLFLLLMRYSPNFAVTYAILGVFVLSWLGKDRITPKKAFFVMNDSARDFAPLGASCGPLGIITGAVFLTGIGVRLSGVIMGVTGGLLWLALPLVMLLAIILGIGLPTPMVYLIMAVTLAPTMLDLGIVPIAAHLFIFYAGMMAMVTPPVAVAAYAGATIAGTDFWRTGVVACMLSAPAYILAFSFPTDTALLMMGSPMAVILSTVRVAIGVFFVALGLFERYKSRWGSTTRWAFFVGGVLLILPLGALDIAGAVLLMLAGLLYLGAVRARQRPADKGSDGAL